MNQKSVSGDEEIDNLKVRRTFSQGPEDISALYRSPSLCPTECSSDEATDLRPEQFNRPIKSVG